MGEQKNKKSSTENKGRGGSAKSDVTIVLKADLHCEGCITKVLKCIRSCDGVDSAYIGGEQRITIVGKVDPTKLQDKVEKKTHRKFELVSPQPRKEENNNSKEKAKGKENNNGDGDGNVTKEKKKESSNDKNVKKNPTEKEMKTLVTTVMLKVHLHCEGCIKKINNIVTKTKGYKEMKIDKEKDLVTVTGAMDMLALVQVLKKHLKKDVEILPLKKDTDKKEKHGGEKQKNVNEKGKNNNGTDKTNVGGGGRGGGGGEKMEAANKVQLQQAVYANPSPYVYPYPNVYGPSIVGEQYFYYNSYAYGPYHAPQLFSDENPNACNVM